MLPVGYDLWFFPDSLDFGESVAGQDFVVPLPPETVILKTVYVRDSELTGLMRVRRQLEATLLEGRDDLLLLRAVPSTDGPPFRAVLIYRLVQGGLEMTRFDPRFEFRFAPTRNVRAFRYGSIRARSSSPLEADYLLGRAGYFSTGLSDSSGELWRIARLEADALDRLVLTLAPVRLPDGLAMPEFARVPNPQLRGYLTEQFEAFQRAVVSSSHFAVIDRAANVAEGVLSHALTQLGRTVPDTLAQRLAEAKTVLEEPRLRGQFIMSDYAYHLAHKIRLLHSFIHEDQAAKREDTVRPEVGMGVASDLSELLVEVGLGRY